VVVVVGAVVVEVLVVVLVVVVDVCAELIASTGTVVEVASGVVGGASDSGTVALFAAPADPGRLMPSESERPSTQPATVASATTSRMAGGRTNRT
jgi:hypothetical protein